MKYPESEILATFAETLNIPYGFERSVKFCDRQMLDDRFLMTVYKASLGDDPVGVLATLCEQLNAPSEKLNSILALLPEADIVHLGFEAEHGARLCKLYVEFASRVRAATEKGGHAPLLVHKALKWDVDKPQRNAIAHYWLKPDSEESKPMEVLSRSLGEKNKALSSFIQQIVTLVKERVTLDELMWLEVEEPGNPRRSLDLNLYDAEMVVGDISHLLELLAGWFLISPVKVSHWLEENAGQPLGHISSGVARNGQPFATVYFGIEGR